MTLYIFETMSASDAANFTSTDQLAFLSTGVSSLNVVDNAATALTTESLTISSGSQSLTFSAAQLSAASLANHLTFNSDDVLLLGTSAAGDTLDLSTGHGVTTDTPHTEAWGFGGDDHITASLSNDTIFGGAGNDEIDGNSSGTDADGNFIENDYYMGGAGDDQVFGDSGNDHIYGNSITSTAGAVDGDDQLFGNDGNDYIQGNAGQDDVEGGNGNDRLYGGAGDDQIYGEDGNDYIQGNKGDDFSLGGIGNDTMHGGAGDDIVAGEDDNDQLFGDNGNDQIYGQGGFDQLTGGAGNDRFYFFAGDASDSNLTSNATAVNHGLVDQIMDFTKGQDTISVDFTVTAVIHGSTGASFSAASAAEDYAKTLLLGHSDEVVALNVGSDTYLFYDDTGGDAVNAAVKVLGVAASTFANDGSDFF